MTHIGFDDFIVGVLYGEPNELNANYLNLKKEYVVLVGKEFWLHLTGKEDYYTDLITAFGEVAKEVDGRVALEAAIDQLTQQIEGTRVIHRKRRDTSQLNLEI